MAIGCVVGPLVVVGLPPLLAVVGSLPFVGAEEEPEGFVPLVVELGLGELVAELGSVVPSVLCFFS